MPFQVFEAESRSILSTTSGFIAQAGFTHSLTPARNCTFGCTYCYVPTMGLYGGLKPADWEHWGQFTTFKSNAPELLLKTLRPDQAIYCSPLVDPYQPVEAERQLMPRILDAVMKHPPRVFVLQTRGPLIIRDLPRLVELSRRTNLRVSFSLTTDNEKIRRLYEPRCAAIADRVDAIQRLREAGISTFATLAPLLPCNPEKLAALALSCTDNDVVADPLHVRAVKQQGATTRRQGIRLSIMNGYRDWLDPVFQAEVLAIIQDSVAKAGRRCAAGTEGFSWLAK
jgi:DNA repair photolyase